MAQTLSFTQWKRELVAMLEARGVPGRPDGTWRKFYQRGFAPEVVASIEQEDYEIDEAMNGEDDDLDAGDD